MRESRACPMRLQDARRCPRFAFPAVKGKGLVRRAAAGGAAAIAAGAPSVTVAGAGAIALAGLLAPATGTRGGRSSLGTPPHHGSVGLELGTPHFPSCRPAPEVTRFRGISHRPATDRASEFPGTLRPFPRRKGKRHGSSAFSPRGRTRHRGAPAYARHCTGRRSSTEPERRKFESSERSGNLATRESPRLVPQMQWWASG
jgi:hypothetical protein